ncbi:MAG: hypothetical protein ACRD3L_07510 [Terriglobales bacterium]
MKLRTIKIGPFRAWISSANPGEPFAIGILARFVYWNQPVEDLTEIRAELIQLLQKQLETLDLAAFVALTDAEWDEYDARHNRIRELQAKLRPLKNAA